MSDSLFTQLVGASAGLLLLTAVLVLWRRELPVVVRLFALQGLALTALVGVLAVHEGSAELGVVAASMIVVRVWLLPRLLRGALEAAGPEQRETSPLVNVAASLLAAAGLTLVALAVSRPIIELAEPGAGAITIKAVPVGLAVVLIGFFVLVTRRRALSQVVGFLLMDNGITAVGFLTSAGLSLVVELGVALDVLLAVLVLGVLTGRMREAFGTTDLDELRELHD